jgi:hypothetical protein
MMFHSCSLAKLGHPFLKRGENSIGGFPRRAAVALVAMATLLIMPGRSSYADVIDSDVVTVKGVRTTILEADDLGESPISFMVALPKFGYALMCEDVDKCGAGNGFKDVSDLLLSVGSIGGGKEPGLIFVSDAFTPDFVKKTIELAGLNVNTSFLGQTREDGKQQDLSKFFGAPDNTVLVTSDLDPKKAPEPATLSLLAVAAVLLGILQFGRRQSRV